MNVTIKTVYTYRAEMFCSDRCVIAAYEQDRLERFPSDWTVETLAEAHGIDLGNLYSFDSDDFPKPCSADDVDACGEWCGTCGNCVRCGDYRVLSCDHRDPGCLTCQEPCSQCESPKVHVHLYTQSRDCDGLYERSRVIVCPLDEPNEHDEYRWWIEQQGWLLPTTADEPVTIEFRFMESMSYVERTDEGFRSVEARLCRDACDLDERSFRDHTAEAAGY